MKKKIIILCTSLLILTVIIFLVTLNSKDIGKHNSDVNTDPVERYDKSEHIDDITNTNIFDSNESEHMKTNNENGTSFEYNSNTDVTKISSDNQSSKKDEELIYNIQNESITNDYTDKIQTETNVNESEKAIIDIYEYQNFTDHFELPEL